MVILRASLASCQLIEYTFSLILVMIWSTINILSNSTLSWSCYIIYLYFWEMWWFVLLKRNSILLTWFVWLQRTRKKKKNFVWNKMFFFYVINVCAIHYWMWQMIAFGSVYICATFVWKLWLVEKSWLLKSPFCWELEWDAPSSDHGGWCLLQFYTFFTLFISQIQTVICCRMCTSYLPSLLNMCTDL